MHMYKPLVRKLVVVFIVTGLLGLAALLYFDERLVKRMSSSLITKATEAIDENLQRQLSANGRLLTIALAQVETLSLGETTSDDELYSRLVPFLLAYPALDSINLADTAGNEFVVIRDPDGFLTRRLDSSSPNTARWQRVRDGASLESWERSTDAAPQERPWFKGAMQHEPRSRYWTEPYTFLSTKEPGVSVSTRWQPANGEAERVIAFNISLVDVSRMTMARRPSSNGMTFVFDKDDRLLGLPAVDRFATEQAITAAELLPLSQLGMPQIDRAINAWSEAGREEGVFSYTGAEGAKWWAGFARIQLDDSHAVWSGVLVPRSDLLGALVNTRNLVIVGIFSTGLLIGAIILFLSLRSIKRQMKQVVDRIEQRLGQYHIEDKIGEGGNGTVYRARHALLRRPTALKLMSPEFARSEAARKRFEDEVRLTSGLSHPNTVAIFDFGRTGDGTLYYAMEMLGGSTLNRLVQVAGPLPAGRAIHFLTQACGSLAEAHQKGLIHRDIKPSNLIVCERGGLYDVLKVVDFGLVKEMAQVDGNLTQADVLIGTPFFMAPEIISKPGAASPLSDIYALGAVGYFIITGRHVFEGESAVEICAAHLHDTPERPSVKAGRDVPEDLERILLQCLEKEPSARPASANDLRDALSACGDAGAWDASDAKSWWREFASGLSDGHAGEDDVPMSRTELFVDLDSRLVSVDKATRTVAGGGS